MKTVSGMLQGACTHASIERLLAMLCEEPRFKHVAALANTGKHRGVVKPALNEDLTGERTNRHELRFTSFRYGRKDFPEATLASVLEPAYAMASRATVDIGIKLNEFLAPPPI